jgi:hypothetical protein
MSTLHLLDGPKSLAEKAGVGGSTPSLATIIQYPFVHGNRFQGIVLKLFDGCLDDSLNRPCTITKFPSATIVPGSYFNVGGMFLMRLNRPSRSGAI